MSEWRDMESAPMRGYVLLWCPSDNRACPAMVGSYSPSWRGWESTPGKWRVTPSHWMPLPLAPDPAP